MKEVWEYDKWKAVLTFVFLSLGSIIIFASNSKDAINTDWQSFFLVIIPLLFVISFLPLLTDKIGDWLKSRKSPKFYKDKK